MRNRETGEFEVIVGNRQLLSGFFIVVLLFAVAFAMGYVVGQNSPRSERMAGGTSPPTPITSAESRPQPTSPASAPAGTEQPAGTDTSAQTPGGAAPGSEGLLQPTTQPVRDSQAAAETPPPPPPPSTQVLDTPPPGSYWQVHALLHPDAEIIVRTLRDKGFPALMSRGPNDLIRVLVGPYTDTQAMGRAKTDLENAGFRNLIRR